MFTVSFLLEHQGQLSYEEKLNAKRQGPPRPTFRFEGSRQCNFPDQYAKHKWICGCPEKKSFFCFPCLLCGQAATVWTTNGVKDLSNLSNFSRKHEKSFNHVSSCTSYALLGEASFPKGRIMQRDQYNKEVKANREMLRHYIDMGLYLSKQGIPFARYDEVFSDKKHINFIEGLYLLGSYSGNFLLRNSLSVGGELVNVPFEVQNDILESLFIIMKEEIKRRVKAAEYVSILVDETAELNNSIHMCVSIRLVHEGVVHEHLIDIIDQNLSINRSATDLTSLIVTSLGDNAGVNTNIKVVGQAYDGAKKMIGGIDSVSKIIQQLWPTAYLIPCHGHKWEHLVSQACVDLNEVVIFFGVINSLTLFFRSSLKRLSLLNAILPDASTDKWMNQGEAICVIDEHYYQILNLLLSLSKDCNFDGMSRAEAACHANQLQIRVNIFLLKLFGTILVQSIDIDYSLLSSNMEPAAIDKKINDYRQHLIKLRTDEEYFQNLWRATDVVDDKGPPRKRETIEKSEFSEENTAERHLRDLFVQIIHFLLLQVAERFDQVKQFTWIRMLYPNNFRFFSNNPKEIQSYIFQFACLYPNFVSDDKRWKVQLQSLFSDQHISSLLKQKRVRDCGDILKIFIDYKLQDALSDVYTMLLVGTTIPLLNIQSNNEFSVLSRLKKYCQNTSKHSQTKQLILLAVEKEVLQYLSEKPDFYDRVIDVFASMKERSMNLIYRAH